MCNKLKCHGLFVCVCPQAIYTVHHQVLWHHMLELDDLLQMDREAQLAHKHDKPLHQNLKVYKLRNYS